MGGSLRLGRDSFGGSILSGSCLSGRLSCRGGSRFGCGSVAGRHDVDIKLHPHKPEELYVNQVAAREAAQAEEPAEAPEATEPAEAPEAAEPAEAPEAPEVPEESSEE